MPTGIVAHFDEGRKFGFITPDDGTADIFVHAKQLVNADFLRKDQRISFDVAQDIRRGKPQAVNVMVV